MDLCFEAATQFMERLGNAVSTVDEVQGFRYFDDRDLLGFVDGTENPRGAEVTDAVLIAGEDCGNLSDERRTLLRRSEIGFVYQFHHLLPEFSALENVMLPQMIAAAPRRRAREKAAALLDRVGLAARAGHRPARLSGGEQQRVAIARALANDPKILLGDEPTGNLDHATGDSVLETLLDLVRHSGLAALIATHNLDLARRLDRIVALEDGQLRTVA